MIEKVKRINNHIPETGQKLTITKFEGKYIEKEYLILGPEPDENEMETGEWCERILAINEYKTQEIEPRLDGAIYTIYILTGETPC